MAEVPISTPPPTFFLSLSRFFPWLYTDPTMAGVGVALAYKLHQTTNIIYDKATSVKTINKLPSGTGILCLDPVQTLGYYVLDLNSSSVSPKTTSVVNNCPEEKENFNQSLNAYGRWY